MTNTQLLTHYGFALHRNGNACFAVSSRLWWRKLTCNFMHCKEYEGVALDLGLDLEAEDQQSGNALVRFGMHKARVPACS